MGKAQVAGCAGGAGERTEQACSHHRSGHCRTSWEERKELLAGLAKWLVGRSENKMAGSCLKQRAGGICAAGVEKQVYEMVPSCPQVCSTLGPTARGRKKGACKPLSVVYLL